jgi:signal transduction histidine kinase
MVRSLSEVENTPAHEGDPIRVALFGSYTCPVTRSLWPCVSAVGDALGDDVDLRFGHTVGVVDIATAQRVAEAAEAACGQGGFGRMHGWLMDHPECHAAGEASEWADAAGLDVARFRADLWEGATASVHAHQIAARAMGADQGPSLWLGGARYTGPVNFTSLLRACKVATTSKTAQRDGVSDQRDEWLALAAHELRAPVSVLCTLTGIMVAQKEAGVAPDHAHLVVLRRVVRGMCRLIEQMTTTAALQGDYTRAPRCETMELGSFTRDVVEALTYESPRRSNVVVRAAVPVYGTWPPGWIEQIVGNLVGNALKFGGEGQVDVDVFGDDALATVIVRDHGPGLAIEDWPRLMQAYERGTSSRGVPGLGLGLHVVHMLVGAMGGRISVDSAPGHGAAFRVTWPIDTSVEATVRPCAGDAAHPRADAGSHDHGARS